MSSSNNNNHLNYSKPIFSLKMVDNYSSEASPSNDTAKEQERLLPIANVGRIMKQILPSNAKISKEAKETMQECVSEFIGFVTGEASEKCRKERRKTVNGDDVCWALGTLGFDEYAGPLKRYLDRYRDIKELSNVKEEVYGALDSFIAWELEFPLITVKKALKHLENEKEWKRIIQVTKWMLSKGQGRTMGSYYALLNALAEDGRLDEAEELWHTLFTENLESMPRMFFERMISIYYHREMNDKMFEKLDMLDKYEKLKKKYPPPKWEYRYIKGKRIKVRTKYLDKTDEINNSDMEAHSDSSDERHENAEVSIDERDEGDKLYLPETTDSNKTN
ncbi:hypothetical protein BUALT_Bualt12G0121500 [Buddleja alternifolia]|uniref:Transcription factor CBF/NF-Y/archaeal histone domain-containing protein n=1 Tax=Buddleja alternifolia TaxID=168488 RepID=A0AAV6WXV9_9LAMI|nr:hypothetical protein BUALT_Bualt12G0121500 [Buddleja alternifolia]